MTQDNSPARKDENPGLPSAELACTDVRKLVAFARAYGSVRYFHPSDAAAGADWDVIAVEGVRRVRAANNREQLLARLRETFEPIAPTLRFELDGIPSAPKVEQGGTGPVVAWQHLGSGSGDQGPISIYQSARTHRPRMKIESLPSQGSLMSSTDAAPLRGKTIRLSARVRVQARARGAWATLWLRVERADAKLGYCENMEDRPIVSQAWQCYELTAEVADDAISVGFGGTVHGAGSFWFDEFSLSVVEGAELVQLDVKTPSFGGTVGSEDWFTATSSFEYDIVKEGDRRVLRISPAGSHETTALFEARPPAFDTIDVPLGLGLGLKLPVALPDSIAAEAAVRADAAQSQLPGLDDAAVRIASVIMAWNEFAHFYPYFDVIDENWGEVLEQSLAEVLETAGAEDLRVTLDRMLARLHDGHIQVSGPFAPLNTAAVRFARVEGRVIIASAAPARGLERGDEVESIDDIPIDAQIKLLAARVSGSPQWVEHGLLHRGSITRGAPGSFVTIGVLRNGRRLNVQVLRDSEQAPPVYSHEPSERLEDGVMYVDLDRVPWPDLESRLSELAAAPAVVFDLRGYPRGNHQILNHLLTRLDTSKWMFVPEVIYPHQRDARWRPFGWHMLPAEPHIPGPIAFIIGPGAISYAESVLGIVEGHALGHLVGAPTAGTNGNVNSFVVAGHICITYTGMKVTRLDGRQHHLIGVLPTVPVEATIAGITAGRDELYEAALSVVRGSRRWIA